MGRPQEKAERRPDFGNVLSLVRNQTVLESNGIGDAPITDAIPVERS
jgi:hypothetical protein